MTIAISVAMTNTSQLSSRVRLVAIALVTACDVGSVSEVSQPLDCGTYCTSITASCTAANSQYASMATCVASCAHFPVGTAGAKDGDTLACRAYHADAAMMDPSTHCVHAGPSGGNVCGSPCNGFCDLVTAECATQYPDKNACMTTCAGFATTPSYTSTVESGNSLSCRIFHATAAATDPSTHCMHTTSTSAPCM